MDFVFSDRAKKVSFILMGLGLVLYIVGLFTGHHGEHASDRVWVNLLSNGFLFFGVGLGALFFVALQYAAEAAWGTLLKRVFEAVMAFMPIGIIVLIIVFIGATFHMNHIYHWMADGVTDPTSEHYDAIIAGKSGYLNKPFFWIRAIVYFATFMYFSWWFRKKSIEQDKLEGTEIHFMSVTKAAIFLVLFGVFSSSLSWDWIMSIDTHWFSTMFGWYCFSGIWLSAIIVILVTTLYLKSKGYLEQVNENHIHDLGKWMFALSFLWTYLWFCQFMLIWYSNIPEEVTYYVERINEFKAPFFGTMLLNFILPILILMSRDSKRNYKLLLFLGVILFFGRYLDITMLVQPGTLHHWNFGLMEIGMFVLFCGGMMFVILRTLTKAPLVVKNHPFLDESVHHHF